MAKKRKYKKRKKDNSLDLKVIGTILISILLAILIYANSGSLGSSLSDMLGGMMGWIKYVLPIGTFAIAIKIACNEKEPDREIDQLALTLEYAIENHYQPPKNFYGVGGLKIFRDLIYQMQGLMREDHRFYKEHGFYDFPQKRKAMILGMYLVGSMMNSKKLSKKLGAKMTEGMLMPYQQVIKKTKKKHGKA